MHDKFHEFCENINKLFHLSWKNVIFFDKCLDNIAYFILSHPDKFDLAFKFSEKKWDKLIEFLSSYSYISKIKDLD
jgi:hypothetical protein